MILPIQMDRFLYRTFFDLRNKNGSTLKMRILTSKLRNLRCQMMSNVKIEGREQMCVDCFEFDILVFFWWHCVPLGSLMTGSGHHGHHTCGTLWPSKAKSLGHVAPQAVGMKWCSSALRLSGFMVGSSTHGVKPWGQPGQPIWVCVKLGYISNLLVLLPTMFSASSHHSFWFLDRKCSSLADFPAVWDVCFRHLRWKSLAKPAHLGPRGVQPAPLIYHSGSSVILQKGYLNPRSTLEVSYIYHAYLSSKWGPKQSFTRVDQAGWLSQPCVESTHNSQVPDSIQLWVTTRLVHQGSENLSAENLGWSHEVSYDSKFAPAEFPRLWTRKPGNGQWVEGNLS
jgi:hypothetical protein